MEDLIERFTEKIEEPFDVHNDCWKWTSSINPDGYGNFWMNWRSAKAHRVAYELFVGPIPEGFEIDHLCRNRACVRPDHLEPVPRVLNMMRGEGNGSQTHCPAGHPYDEQNTYYWTNPQTGYTARYCRACHAKLTLAAYHRRKER
jgi:HNH endonuclease